MEAPHNAFIRGGNAFAVSEPDKSDSSGQIPNFDGSDSTSANNEASGERKQTVHSLCSTAANRFGDSGLNSEKGDELNLKQQEVPYKVANGKKEKKEREEFLAKEAGVRQHETHVDILLEISQGSTDRLQETSGTEDVTNSTSQNIEGNSHKIRTEQRRKGRFISKEGDIVLIAVNQEEVRGFSENPKIRRIVVGGDQPSNDEHKVVLLFGSRGVGKTSLVGSIINYLYGVKKEDTFRFVLGKDSGPTECLTEYVINRSILPYRVTVVDTPGVIDVKGYKGTSSLIREWFMQELKKAGKFHLDAITLVLKNDEEELGWPYIHELAEVKRMFGDDLKTNVLPIITHTEVLPQPLAVRALAYANVTFLDYYKVNNSGFQPTDSTTSKPKRNLFFDHGSMSLERYFTDLHELACPLFAASSSSGPPSSASAVRESSQS